jgi:hypothetical protein
MAPCTGQWSWAADSDRSWRMAGRAPVPELRARTDAPLRCAALWRPMQLRLRTRPPGRAQWHRHIRTQFYVQNALSALQPILSYDRTAADNWATTPALTPKDQAGRFAQINRLWLQGGCQFCGHVMLGTHSFSAQRILHLQVCRVRHAAGLDSGPRVSGRGWRQAEAGCNLAATRRRSVSRGRRLSDGPPPAPVLIATAF